MNKLQVKNPVSYTHLFIHDFSAEQRIGSRMLHRFLPELQCKAACRRDPLGQPLPIHDVFFRIDCIQPAPERFVYPLIPFFLRRTPDLFFCLAVSAACYKNARCV